MNRRKCTTVLNPVISAQLIKFLWLNFFWKIKWSSVKKIIHPKYLLKRNAGKGF